MCWRGLQICANMCTLYFIIVLNLFWVKWYIRKYFCFCAFSNNYNAINCPNRCRLTNNYLLLKYIISNVVLKPNVFKLPYKNINMCFERNFSCASRLTHFLHIWKVNKFKCLLTSAYIKSICLSKLPFMTYNWLSYFYHN